MGCGGSKNVSVVDIPRSSAPQKTPNAEPQKISYSEPLKSEPRPKPLEERKYRAVEPAQSLISLRKSVVNLRHVKDEDEQPLINDLPKKSTDVTYSRPASAASVRPASVLPEPEVELNEEVDDFDGDKQLERKAAVNRKPKLSLAHEDVLISFEEVSKKTPETIEEMWELVQKTSYHGGVTVHPTTNRKGWRTIRIFVSSTFKDFHNEREVLVKEVFPDLRLWCESRKLRLVECDLRWGVPKDSTGVETITICLTELDRCYSDNTIPFFLNLCGERAGWIPSFEDLTTNLSAQYGWVHGLSVTEMEIVHGAFRNLNPNALFMLRNEDALDPLTDEVKPDFVDAGDHAVNKLKALKSRIEESFPENCVFHYNVKAQQDQQKVIFEGLENEFSETVHNFFKSRIEELYPLDPSPEDPLVVQREAHETFLTSRSEVVLGRDGILSKIMDYVKHDTTCSPLLIIGTAGSGKSAVLAKAAADAQELARSRTIPACPGGDRFRVIFHFVGATPGSTDLAFFLQRLTKEIKPDMKDILSDLDGLVQQAYSLLSNPNTLPTLLFIDAVNQMDEDKQQLLPRWLPEKLSRNVRVVVSTIDSTYSHKTLRSFRPSPTEIQCEPLDMKSRTEIVTNILRVYNKRLDPEQNELLVTKLGASNPLWLTLACEELRVFGKFETLTSKIQELPDDLIDLEMEVFRRFEAEAGGRLMTATLCLLETSRHGLLETELLALLGDEKNTVCPPFDPNGTNAEEIAKSEKIVDLNQENEVEQLADQFTKDVDDAYKIKDKQDGDKKEEEKKKAKKAKRKQVNYLPARDWAVIYRNLKQLLRPCGDLGEGRLDFYHRSLSKAVRKRFFIGTDEYQQHVGNFWHGILATYFEGVDDMDRKAEELPYHLEHLLDNNRLIRCLLEWPVFERLYDEDFSIDLMHSWLKAGGYSVASQLYKEALKVHKNSGVSLAEHGDLMEKVGMFCIQMGQTATAVEVLEERLKMEEEQLGQRAGQLADIYQLIAKCKSEDVKQHDFVTMAQLDEDLEVMVLCRKALHYRMQLNSDDDMFKLALLKVLMVHHLGILADLEKHKSVEHRFEATKIVNEAIQYYNETQDLGHLAEAIMTRSFVSARGEDVAKKKKDLDEAMELCMKAYGENHLLYTRLCLNIGIYHEDNGDDQTAYDYFVRWNDATISVLGANHPKTIRAIGTLQEPKFKSIREERERSAASQA